MPRHPIVGERYAMRARASPGIYLCAGTVDAASDEMGQLENQRLPRRAHLQFQRVVEGRIGAVRDHPCDEQELAVLGRSGQGPASSSPPSSFRACSAKAPDSEAIVPYSLR